MNQVSLVVDEEASREMEGNRARTLPEVRLDCHVCSSGNHFRPAQLERELACDDCGFSLSGGFAAHAGAFENCIFCGSGHFYYVSPFLRPALGRDSICYVCEARYRGARVGSPDEKFNSTTHSAAQKTSSAADWKRRAEEYDRSADERPT